MRTYLLLCAGAVLFVGGVMSHERERHWGVKDSQDHVQPLGRDPSSHIRHSRDLSDLDLVKSGGRTRARNIRRTRRKHNNTPSPNNRHARGEMEELQRHLSSTTERPQDLYTNMSDPNATETSVCRPCEMRDARRELRIEMIKKELLAKLKLTEPPRVNNPRNISDLPIITLPNAEPSHGSPPDSGDFITYIFGVKSPHKDYIDAHGPPELDPRKIVHFTLSEDVLSGTLHKAHLLIWLKEVHVSADAVGLIRIFKLSNDSTGRITKPSVPSRTKQFFLNRKDTGEWHNISFKDISLDWKIRPSDNFGLYIEAINFDTGENIAVIQPDTNSTDYNHRPGLLLDIRATKRRRTRRMIEGHDCTAESPKPNCCRYPLIIDFSEFGSDWDFIIAPRRYNAYYCAGQCPLTTAVDAQSHLVHLAKDSSLPGGPCCTPTKQSSIIIIHRINDDMLKRGVFPDMKAESCGCR